MYRDITEDNPDKVNEIEKKTRSGSRETGGSQLGAWCLLA